MPRFYQIRMRFGVGGEDLAGSVWDTDHIGIWFGSWLPEEFEKTLGLQAEERLRVLNRINDQRGVGWHFQKDGELAVVRRFYDITAEDWICTCFGGRVHIGHVSGPVERGEERFDRKRLQDTGFEMFKWRSVKKVNSFLL